MRLLITGMGGELGTRFAQLLETNRDVSDIAGLDVDPPRRRLRRAEFHRINPRDRTRSVAFVRAFDPDVVVHLGIYEPNAADRSARAPPSGRAPVRCQCSARRPSARRSERSSCVRASRCTGVAADARPCRTKTSPAIRPLRSGCRSRRSRTSRSSAGMGRRRARHAAAHGAGRRSPRAEPSRPLSPHGTRRPDQRVRRPHVLASPSGGRCGCGDRRSDHDHRTTAR